MTKKEHSSLDYIRVLFRVGRTAFRMAPGAAALQLFDAIIQASLPLITTYFAALTTTALANAYAGDTDSASRVVIYVLATSAAGLFMLLWTSVSGYISKKTQQRVEATVEDDMLRQFSALPFYLYDDKETVDLYEKAKRFSYVFSYIFTTISGMFASVVSAVAAMLALVVVSPWLTLVVLLAAMPSMVIQIHVSRQRARQWEGNITNRRRRGNMGWMLRESTYIAEMRVYGVVKRLIMLHASLRNQEEKEVLRIELRSVWKQSLSDVVKAFVELGSLIWIVFEISNRHQPVGQFLYVQQMVSRALGSAGDLATKLGQIDEDLANVVDYEKFMQIDTVQDSGTRLDRIPSVIEVRNLSFSYPKTNSLVLKNINMTIPKGRHVAIVGENGAGKSTLVKLLMGLYSPTSGEVIIDKISLEEISLESWHGHIALLDQNFVRYYFATIRENITLGNVNKRVTDENVRRAMMEAEFTSVVDKLPSGDATYTERWMAEDGDEISATELSGGQYQRLALARNFYRDAPIVILDEPTSAIDALAEARIFKRLFGSKKTIIAVSHRLSTVQKADMVYMMLDGEIVEQGAAAELIAKRGEFYRMFESQIH